MRQREKRTRQSFSLPIWLSTNVNVFSAVPVYPPIKSNVSRTVKSVQKWSLNAFETHFDSRCELS